MIQNDGYYISENGIVVEKFEDTLTDHPMDDRYAHDIVTTCNSNVQDYNQQFADSVKGRENDLTFSDWMKFQEGLMPYVRKAAETVHRLHAVGYTEYKVNMQSGLIS